jgi:hypothetical protein
MEEAATPLPSEETTPPVTNIYFGAIRIARVMTRFTTPDCSYLSGKALQKPRHRIDVQTIMCEPGHSVNCNSSRPRIENFHRCATFSWHQGSNLSHDAGFAHLAGSTAFVQLFLPTLTFVAETNCAKPSSKLESN